MTNGDQDGDERNEESETVGYAGPDRHFVTTSFPPRAKKPRN